MAEDLRNVVQELDYESSSLPRLLDRLFVDEGTGASRPEPAVSPAGPVSGVSGSLVPLTVLETGVRQQRRRRRAQLMAAAVVGGAVLLGGLWSVTRSAARGAGPPDAAERSATK
jgi:hypothetical protein